MDQDITLKKGNQNREILRMDLNKFQAIKDLGHLYQNHKDKTKKMKLVELKRRRITVKYPNIYRGSTNKKRRSWLKKPRKKRTQRLHQALEECQKTKDRPCLRN